MCVCVCGPVLRGLKERSERESGPVHILTLDKQGSEEEAVHQHPVITCNLERSV